MRWDCLAGKGRCRGAAAPTCLISRDFVPWRFSDAHRERATRGSECRRPRNLHRSGHVVSWPTQRASASATYWYDCRKFLCRSEPSLFLGTHPAKANTCRRFWPKAIGRFYATCLRSTTMLIRQISHTSLKQQRTNSLCLRLLPKLRTRL
jgi:hypothetical protein